MRHSLFLILCLIYASFPPLFARESEITFANLPYKKNIKENILSGRIFSEVKVESSRLNKNSEESLTQSFNFSISGLHNKDCQFVLKKLSLYESYTNFLDFVKESKYNEKKEEINFLLSHVLMPFDMRLIFRLPRITKPGVYNFGFDQGFLKGLTGKIHVVNHTNKCLFYTTAQWQGPHTQIPNKVLEIFTRALSIHSMTHLFRISQTLAH